MHAFSTGLALLLALGILAIGSQYVLNPTRMSRNFGLPLPDGANTTWWLRLKGVRDIVSGLLVIALMAWGNPRDLAMLLLVQALIPVGDALVIFGAKGSTKHALGIHASTAAVMFLTAGLLMAGAH
jgi:hypothetical protein